jgi:DNA-binding beta-propeller fold protein YncE
MIRLLNRHWPIAATCFLSFAATTSAAETHLLYVAAPGIRNDLQYGGAGILVFDMDDGHKFVKRIETPASRREKPENIKGVCASAATRKLYFTTPTRLACVDLITEQPLWEKELPQGCDRLSIVPDGSILYVPSFEKDIWNVVEGATGNVLATVEAKSGAHNTVGGLDGKRMYLAGLRSPLLRIVDTATHQIVGTAGPFSAAIRPFTVNGTQTRCYVCVNGLLGFEIGDLSTGKMLRRVAVEGFETGPAKRHGCPSHGVGLTPDEREIWVCDAHNSRLHVFDLTSDEPRQVASVRLRDEPGWVTFSVDGRFAYASTGEVIDPRERKIVVALQDEQGRPVHSEKVVEIDFADGAPVRVGDQFGVGRKLPSHAAPAAP